MGLRLLHTGDLHLDSAFSGFPPAIRQVLQEAMRTLPEQLLRHCRETQADMVLLAGDVFDGPYQRPTARLLAEALEDCGVPVMITPGNHDFYGPSSPWQQELWPENVHIFTGNLSYVDLEALDCRVYGGAFQSMDCPGLLEGFRAERVLSHTVGVLHGDPVTGNSPYCPITMGQVAASDLDYLALGHIHRGCSFQAGRTLCAWPGCPMGRGWDETGRKGMLLAELTDRVTLRTLPMQLPAFFDETVDVERERLEDRLPPVDSGDLYRVTLTGRGAPDLEALARQYRYLTWLELRDRTLPPTDIWAGAGEDSLRGVLLGLLQTKYAQAQGTEAETIRLSAELCARLLDGEEVALP